MPNTTQATRPDIDAQEMERPRRSRAISNQSNASRNDDTDPSALAPTAAMGRRRSNGIRLRSGYEWPLDRADAVADWADRYPMPPLDDDLTRLIVGIVGGTFAGGAA
jgi:hypothetical protein